MAIIHRSVKYWPSKGKSKENTLRKTLLDYFSKASEQPTPSSFVGQPEHLISTVFATNHPSHELETGNFHYPLIDNHEDSPVQVLDLPPSSQGWGMHDYFLGFDYLCAHLLSTRPLLPSTRPQQWWCKMCRTMQLRVGQLSLLCTDCLLFRMPTACVVV